MKVRLTTEVTGLRVNDGDYRQYPSVGETLDVPDTEAEAMLANGTAVRVEEETPPPSEDALPGDGILPLLTSDERREVEEEEGEARPVESARQADDSEKAVRETTPNRKSTANRKTDK